MIKRFQASSTAGPDLHAWAQRYGINLRTIPIDAVISVDHEKQTISFIEFVLDDNDKYVVHNGKAATRRHTVHLTMEKLVDPPDMVDISTLRTTADGAEVPRA